MTTKFYSSILVALLLLTATADNLLIRNGKPHELWPRQGATVTVENGSLKAAVPHGGVCNGNVTIDPTWKYLRLDMEMRVENLTRGPQSWQCGRMAMRFYGADKKAAGEWPQMFEQHGTTEWAKCSRIYEIPAGAVRLALDPANFGKSGTVYFRNVVLQSFATKKEAEEAWAGLPIPPREKLWSMKDAERIRVPGRDRITLNALWQAKIAESASEQPPRAEAYDLYFKVPGIWPGYNSWKQPGSSQIFFTASGSPRELDGKKINHLWQRRTIDVPAEWKGQKIGLEIVWLQTCAQLFVDGQKCGELFFPGGTLDLTRILTPGKRHELALLVSARIDDAASVSFNAPDRLSKVKKQIVCRGITGDVYLKAEPDGPRLSAAQLIPSVKNSTLSVHAELEKPDARHYRVNVQIFDNGKPVRSFESAPIQAKDGKLTVTESWENPKLWDTDTPQNLYTAVVTLKDAAGKMLDTLYPIEFGFREFELRGRDFYLNGKRLHLRICASQLPVAGAAFCTPEAYRENAAKMKEFGMNFCVPLNYNFAPGETGYQDAFYQENSRNGILTSMTLPHPSGFGWDLDAPEMRKRYLELTGYLVRRYRNTPGVLLYASTHNATGYMGDQNPARIDGSYSPDPFMKKSAQNAFQRREQGLKAAELTATIDPTRPVYHHESGNLGPMYTINCYLNWAPSQERSDWLEHWEAHGEKPLFMMEWGMPHVCSWSSFRGPAFIWGAEGVQCIWLNEFNAQYLGEEAYRASADKKNLMNAQLKLGLGNRKVHFGKYNFFSRFQDVQAVWALLIADNFRDMRARGLTGLLPWDQDAFFAWLPRKYRLTEERFDGLKKTGIRPDLVEGLIDNFDRARTPAGEVASRAFQPVIGWIAGAGQEFTAKNTFFRPGEKVEKSLMLLNDTRQAQSIDWSWSVPELPLEKSGTIRVAPGGRVQIPIEFSAKAGVMNLQAEFRTDNGSTQKDTLELRANAAPKLALNRPLLLHDPEKSAAPLLNALNIPYSTVEKSTDLRGALVLIGRNGLNSFPAPLKSAERILILEQPYETLQQLGLRANEHGLRQLLALAPEFAEKPLSDWRGHATGVPAALVTDEYESQYPGWNWSGFANRRVWRAGNRGSVATVLPEKPAVGDWMPLLQGGFDLQYAPLLEFREGNRIVLFSQLEISGRRDPGPETTELLAAALSRLDRNTPPEPRPVFLLGGNQAVKLLNNLKIPFQKITAAAECPTNGLLILTGEVPLQGVREFVKRGGKVLGIALNEQQLNQLCPNLQGVKTQRSVYSDYAKSLRSVPEFQGISNADLHWRKPLDGAFFPADSPTGKALAIAHEGKGTMVFCQIAPWMFDENEFQFRTTRRRSHFLLSRLAHNLGAASRSGFFDALMAGATRPRDGYMPLTQGWLGKADPQKVGRDQKWYAPGFRADDSWRSVKVPGMFDLQFEDLKGYDGWFWYRKNFDFTARPGETELTLYLGPIDDESWVWLNGEFLGEISAASNPKDFWAAERIYKLPVSRLKAKGNQLTILCNDRQMNGGILGKPNLSWLPEYRLYADTPISEDDPYRYYRW